MLDFLRNLTKSAEEKRQEQLNAYLDGVLSPKERKQFERELAQDDQLRAELTQLNALKMQLRQLPRRQVPRNFLLDPTLHGRPRREPLVQAYPILRTATVLTAFLFIFALAANLFSGGNASLGTSAEIAEPPKIVMETVVLEDEAVEATRTRDEIVVEEAEIVEVTRVVTEGVEAGPAEGSAAREEADSFSEALQATSPAALKATDDTSLMAPAPADTAINEEEAEFAAEAAAAEEVLPAAEVPAAEMPLGETLDREAANVEELIAEEEIIEGVATAVATKAATTTRNMPPSAQAPVGSQWPAISTLGLLAIGLGLLLLILLLLLLLTRRRL